MLPAVLLSRTKTLQEIVLSLLVRSLLFRVPLYGLLGFLLTVSVFQFVWSDQGLMEDVAAKCFQKLVVNMGV